MSDVLHLNADGTPLSLLPLSTISWEDAIKLVYKDKARVVKEYDNWLLRSQYLDIKVPSIIINTTQVKHNKILKYGRGNVYLRDDYTCQLQITGRCRDAKGKVKFTDLTIDHVIPKSYGGKTNWVNCCTSCRTCNSEKGNDPSIVPKKRMWTPTYYEILAKRKKLPLHVHDADWLHYIDWPADLVKVLPQPNSSGK